MMHPKHKYSNHKQAARLRGIEFKFTYDEWVAWWEKNLGPHWQRKRGRNKNQFCMARIKDRGAYKPKNVKCITNNQNANERCHSKETRLKLSLSHAGKPLSAEHKQNITNGLLRKWKQRKRQCK